MAARLFMAEEAEQDIDEAYGYYERQRAGLGEEFMGSVDACIQAICRTPDMHQFAYKQYRRALLGRFPYAVFYEHAENTVTVYGVFHTARDPEKWRMRLSGY